MSESTVSDGMQPGNLDARPPFPSIGRYRIERPLGEGAFGYVFLGRDEDLQRLVAIKVPKSRTVGHYSDAFLMEGRVLAKLDHPNIVPVHDVGRLDDGTCYVVSKYIPGQNLAEHLSASPVDREAAVQMTATLAEALHYSHKHGLVHRDIKPANILLDETGRPYIADFGLALREEAFGSGPVLAGTPQYMSPEQARGEGHLVDGRSDIFSLGVVFYELLCGSRPFRGKTPSEILERVRVLDVKPLRQLDDTIPKELERICLKAISKRAAERYTTALDMAEDLRHFLTSNQPESSSALSAVHFGKTPKAVEVVPKGLRSFDAQDSDFFLGLLPGPRDRDGLPESLRFWKDRIEPADLDEPFRVGLMYGPSGCGKSSLVKAGLLPRLSDRVLSVYVEATAGETEDRLLKLVRRRCPAVPEDLDLTRTLAALRRGQGMPAEKKLLVVIDQFEQWLHDKSGEQETPLVQALRQCDGAHVQCMVMVRDDFWLAASRFMRALEVELVESRNMAMVDLFDPIHALTVLASFGRAFGRLPADFAKLTRDHELFLERATEELAHDGRVVCVRLALFADMVKGKPWSTATLKRVGGIEGLGATFLEETFEAATAPASYRHHREPAQAVLKALLPEAGSDIKGGRQSCDALLKASGYVNRHAQFAELIRVLDTEVRLITPTVSDDEQDEQLEAGPITAGQVESTDSPPKFYQLTHDYLVPSLRDWLARKQKETRRGRALLRMVERSEQWNSRPENRYLPKWWEHFNIRLFSRKQSWTEPQRKMMVRSGVYHGTRLTLLSVLILAIIIVGMSVLHGTTEARNETYAKGLVASLMKAEVSLVPGIVDDIGPVRQWADPLLRNRFSQATDWSPQKLHTALALLPVERDKAGYLVDHLLQAEFDQVPVISRQLADHAGESSEPLWLAVKQEESAARRLRAACALAHIEPGNQTGWDEISSDVAQQLTMTRSAFFPTWKKTLKPVGGCLVKALLEIYRDKARSNLQRTLAAEAMVDYADHDPAALASALAAADQEHFALLLDALKPHAPRAVRELEKILDTTLEPVWDDPPLVPTWTQVNDELLETMATAEGVVDEHFALCFDLPLADLEATCQRLQLSGYRPTQVRPFQSSDSVHVAAVWCRDGCDFKVEIDLTGDQAVERDKRFVEEGYQVEDVVGYLAASDGATRFAVVWGRRNEKAPTRKIGVGLSEDQYAQQTARLHQQGFVRRTHSVVVTSEGLGLHCSVWQKQTQTGSATDSHAYVGPARGYSESLFEGDLQTDVFLGRTPPPLSTRNRYQRRLAAAEASLSSDPDSLNAIWYRALAHYYLGDDEAARADFRSLAERAPDVAAQYRFQALSLARSGRPEEAQTATNRYIQGTDDEALNLSLQAAVTAYQREPTAVLQRLEQLLLEKQEPGVFYAAACAYSEVARVRAEVGGEGIDPYADRAIELLAQAVDRGFQDFEQIQLNPDLDALRDQKKFVELVDQLQLDRQYLAHWWPSTELQSTGLHALAPTEHRLRCQDLKDRGYRPVAVSAAQFAGQLVTASVWHRPLVPDREKEALALQQTNAAVALVKLGRTDQVWPLLAHRPDPRLRSYLIHRLSSLDADPSVLITCLNQELDQTHTADHDWSIARAVLLALGEFPELPTGVRERCARQLVAVYAQHPDPGLHAAVAWLLQGWNQTSQLHKLDQEWATGKLAGDRQWFVTTQGQTMVVLDARGTFSMGSPSFEKDRTSDETLHSCRIGRCFAIGDREVTVEQYLRFDPDFGHNEMYRYPEPDCPIGGVLWYEAAAYCNWLSQQEAIPKDQWCYVAAEDGAYRQGMRLAPDYLAREGYRLPTEAEWEYACRASATTSRYYGETDALLAQYGIYYAADSPERSWPAGRCKPNDFGLFDMHGNVWNWCNDPSENYAVNLNPTADPVRVPVVQDSDRRVLRGASFVDPPSYLRSASRYNSQPSYRTCYVGFRLARTCARPTACDLAWLN